MFSSVSPSSLIKSMIYVNNQYVCVGAGGIIYTSPDLENWTLRTSGVNGTLNSVTYSEELQLYVAVGEYSLTGITLTSPDAITWTERQGATQALNSVIYAEFIHKFVAVGRHRTLVVSSDGINWESIILAGQYDYEVKDVACSDSIVTIISTYNNIEGYGFYSTDGETWTSLPNFAGGLGDNIEYIKELKYFMTNNNAISYDGIYFVKVLPELTTSYNSFLYSADIGTFICVGNNAIIKIYGISTYESIINNVTGTLRDICYSNNLDLFIAITSDGKVYSSKNKVDWVLRYTGNNIILNSITYSKKLGLFVAGGTVYLHSTDGIEWSETASNLTMNKIIYSEEKEIFVSVYNVFQGYGMIEYSTDGYNWIDGEVSIRNNIVDICYSKNQKYFIACDATGYVTTSFNGRSWSNPIRPYNLTNCYNVCYSEILKKYYLIGYVTSTGIKILTSIKGDQWMDETPILDTNLRMQNVLYNLDTEVFTGAIFFPDGKLKSIFKSIDLQNFTFYNSPCPIKYLKNDYIGVGPSGVIVLAKDEIGENIINSIADGSDMNLNLNQGNNIFRIKADSGNVICKVSYRQKYIGV